MRIACFLLCAVVVMSCRRQIGAEREIVLVNADTLDRVGIAAELGRINALNPKLVAIDFQFSQDADARKDTILLHALKNTRNLFMVSVIDDYSGKAPAYKQFAPGSLPVYLATAKTGFANTILDENEMRTLSRFSTHEYVAGNIEYHFGLRIAMAVDSLQAMRFVGRNPRTVKVDYRNGERRFKVLNAADVLDNKVSRKDIEGKIVMLGFMGPGYEDKFFTPLNKNPDEPDMYGLEYLAYIVAQVMESE